MWNSRPSTRRLDPDWLRRERFGFLLWPRIGVIGSLILRGRRSVFPRSSSRVVEHPCESTDDDRRYNLNLEPGANAED